MEKIRVIHFVDRLKRGGTQAVLYEWLSNIDSSKFQFDFLTFLDSDSEYVKEFEQLGSNVYQISSLKYTSIIKFNNDLDAFFRDNKYDIAHGHSKSKNVFFLAAAKKAGIKVRISHSHNTHFQSKALAGEILKPFLKKYSTDLFACSVIASDFLYGKNAFKRGKVMIIPNGINTEIFKYNEEIRNIYREQLGVNNCLLIGHVGRFMDQKNHIFLIDIFNEIHKIIPEAKLILVGDGEEEIIDKVKSKAKSFNIEDQLIMTGVRKDVNKIMQAMDIFVLPSLFEGLPMVGVEAQASGLPCFFSDTITREVDLIGKSEYISIKATPRYWAERICSFNCEISDRSQGSVLVYNAGFDSKSATDMVCRYYEEKMK